MRKLIIGIFCFVVWNSAFTQSSSSPKIFALVVGISNYIDASIPELKFAHKDADAFSAYLKTAPAGSVAADNMILLKNENATRANILRALMQLLSRTREDDMFIFYFSGHGKNEVFENAGYLLSYDTEFENEAGTAISMDDIKSKISRSSAKLKISYIDACHAGLFKSKGKKGVANDNTDIIKAYMQGLRDAPDGEVVVLSSSERQQSIESEKLQHGIFTYYLLKGLKGDADKEQKGAEGFDDGIVTVSELNTYLVNAIEKETNFKQRPSIDGNFDDEFPLSVLKPGNLLANEIARKKKRESREKEPLVPVADFRVPNDEKLPDGMTLTEMRCHGQYVFINMTGIPLIFYAARSTNSTTVLNGAKINTNIKISHGGRSPTPRLRISTSKWPDKVEDCDGKFEDYKFYFRGEQNGKTVYAEVDATVETRKKKYFVLSSDNVNFVDSAPKMAFP